MPIVPIIETERLTLREPRPTDLAASLTMWSDAGFVEFLGGRPLKEEEVWLRLLRYAGNWALLGYGFWVVEEKQSGRFAGEVGFHELHRDTTPSYVGEPEVGWAMAPSFQGQGLAREAVAAALAWGDSAIATEGFACIIEPGHARSIRLAEGFGFRKADDLVYRGGSITLFRRPRRPA